MVRRLVLSTVGTSLLNAHLTDAERQMRPPLLIRLANAAALARDDEAIITTSDRLAWCHGTGR
ncbi:MAG TPA: hypothetical protein DEP84_30705 [Chloroflexi bacterium]|nr:hypothetical protein [Chloroflexota bacterium]